MVMEKLLIANYLETFQKVSKSAFAIQIVKIVIEANLYNLSKEDLIDIDNDISKGVDISSSENRKALEDKVITLKQFKDVRDSLLELGNVQNQLYIARINTQLSSLSTDEPGNAKEKILKATEHLKDAETNLKQVDKFLNFIDVFTKIISNIVTAIEAPSPAAFISSLLQQLDALE